jgi:hypothetical protein
MYKYYVACIGFLHIVRLPVRSEPAVADRLSTCRNWHSLETPARSTAPNEWEQLMEQLMEHVLEGLMAIRISHLIFYLFFLSELFGII